jgi:hypothetical protein
MRFAPRSAADPIPFMPKSVFRNPPSVFRVFRIPYSVFGIPRSAIRISYLDNDYGNWDRKRRGARIAMFNPHYCAALTSLREPMVVIERNSETSFTKESQSSSRFLKQKLAKEAKVTASGYCLLTPSLLRRS